MTKAVIFDFFDVIRTDAYKSWLNANNIPHEGPYFDASHQQDIGATDSAQFLQKLSDLSGRPITRQELDRAASVDADVVAIIAKLSKTYKLALLSNSPSALIREILAEHDLEKYFDEIIVSSEVGMVKPNPDIFNLALAKLGVTPNEAVFIDDNPNHVKAAEHVGLHGIQFVSAKKLREDLAKIKVG